MPEGDENIGMSGESHTNLSNNGNARPNVLVILSDEHSAREVGCYGGTMVETPGIDRLAQRGVLFENAYCNAPLSSFVVITLTLFPHSSHSVNSWNEYVCILRINHVTISLLATSKHLSVNHI